MLPSKEALDLQRLQLLGNLTDQTRRLIRSYLELQAEIALAPESVQKAIELKRLQMKIESEVREAEHRSYMNRIEQEITRSRLATEVIKRKADLICASAKAFEEKVKKADNIELIFTLLKQVK